MAEFFYVLTVIFVAYVVFSVSKDKSAPVEPDKHKSGSEPKSAPPVSPVAAEAPADSAELGEQAEDFTHKPAAGVEGVKNPKTGEFAKIPANYAFAKRWIKEALVSEGLLDRVYKNSELDEATNAKIHLALEHLKSLEKYQP